MIPNASARSRLAYLDYNATAPVRTEVIAAMAAALAESGNPSSVHGVGRNARRRVELGRDALASRLGCRPAEIVFTSGGTEANNLALLGLGRRALLWSAVEHDSVRAVAADWPGAKMELPVDENGVLRLGALEAALTALTEPAVVAVMLANNETGVIQPIAEIAAIVHAHGGLLHVDAIQAFGKISVHFGSLHADTLSVSAHKLGGPQGVGALVVREGVALAPLLKGGGQEQRRRAGTENVAGIVGFGVAADLIDLAHSDQVAALRDRLEAGLVAAAPDAVIFGAGAPRLPNTLSVAMPGVGSETQIMALDLAGVHVSAGSACSSGKVQRSHVLTAMGVSDALAASALRVSLGWTSSNEDIERFLAAWLALYRRTRAKLGATVS